MEDDIEKSPVVKKLRKAKSKLEDNVAGVETQVHKLQKEIEGMRANFEKQLKQKDKMVRDISAEKAKAKSDYEIAHEKSEREKQATQAHYAEETRKKVSVIAQKNKVIAMKQASTGDDPFQNLQRKEKVIEEKMALIKEQGATIAQQRTEINQKKHDINVEYERAIRKLKEKLSVQRNITAERLRDAAEASNLRLELERRTEDVQRLKEELNHQSNSVVPSLMSSIQIKTDRVNQLESQLDSIMSANLSRLHSGPPSHASNIRSGQNNNGQNAIHSHQTNSTVGNDSPQSNQHRKKRRHGQSEPEVKTE
ncbi:hypothetical protein N0V92_001639 [Colletotrichum tropicale]|nr:hypothetical protein N0V92_001639 [Colletotrichum tropicale]